MSSFLIKSSIAKKYWMSLTGLFLCLFLVGHLAGNLQLLGGEEARKSFNLYAEFMTTNPAVKILSYLTYFSIIFHSIDGLLLLTLSNQRARPKGYSMSKPSRNSGFSSRNMGVLGSVVLVFIVSHMAHFWAQMHFGELPVQTYDGKEVKDLYEIVVRFFTQETSGIWWVAFYVFSMGVMGFHLWHGFASAFHSLGFSKKKSWLQISGKVFSVVISLLFAIIPISIYLTSE